MSRGLWKRFNESTYEGDFNEFGQYHGNSIVIWPDGRKYTGEFENIKYHGTGKLILPDGSSYEGKWEKGKRHGYGNKEYAVKNIDNICGYLERVKNNESPSYATTSLICKNLQENIPDIIKQIKFFSQAIEKIGKEEEDLLVSLNTAEKIPDGLNKILERLEGIISNKNIGIKNTVVDYIKDFQFWKENKDNLKSLEVLKGFYGEDVPRADHDVIKQHFEAIKGDLDNLERIREEKFGGEKKK